MEGLDHFLVLTDDIDGTRDFWCGALDLRVGERPPLEFPGYWLYAGDVPCVHVAEKAAYDAHSERIGIAATSGGEVATTTSARRTRSAAAVAESVNAKNAHMRPR